MTVSGGADDDPGAADERSTADVVGEDDADGRGPRRRPRLLALAVAAAVGFGAAQAVDALSVEAAAPALALVTGREPHLEATEGDEPRTTLEVVLVNTGPDTVVLDGAQVEGSGLAWEADRPLRPGQQVTAALREDDPCEGEPDRLSGRPGSPRVRVRVQDRDGADLPALSLVLPGTVGLRYDDHVRAVCALPRLPEALEVAQFGETRQGGAAVVAVAILSRSVRPLQVTEVSSRLPGVRAVLTDAAGRTVPLPLDVPGRSRTEIDSTPYPADPAAAPYRLRLTAGPEACVPEGDVGGTGESASIAYVDAADPGAIAERPVFADLVGLLSGGCS